MTFGQELVDMHTTFMFGKFSVHAWRQYGGLNNKHSILVLLKVKLNMACQFFL